MVLQLGLGLLTAVPKFALSAAQAFQGFRGLRELERQEVPKFEVSPEMQKAFARAEERTKRGFEPEQRAAFRQGQARQQAGAFRRARDISGGGMAGAIRAGIQSANIGAEAEFAARESEQRAANVRYADTLASQIQQQRNLQTQAELQRRQQLEEAYGGAAQVGLTGLAESLTSGLGLGLGLFGGKEDGEQ